MAGLEVGHLHIGYDKEADVLYASYGPPAECTRDEEKSGAGSPFILLVGTDSRTEERTAATIIGYSAFRAAPDISWVTNIGLPEELADYLASRPSFD